jgi:large subunit ribosomal protein L20
VWTVAVNTVEKGHSHAYDGPQGQEARFPRPVDPAHQRGSAQHGITYSVFMSKLKNAGITLDRKALAEVAYSDAEGFKAIVEKVK